MSNIKQDIIRKIKDRRTHSIAIVMHNKPDGDTIGSAVALEYALKSIGKKVVDLIIHEKINPRFAPIIGEKRVNRIINPPQGRKYDLLIMVDFSDPDRTIRNIRKLSKFVIVIDHHTSNSPYGDLYYCEKAASTGMLLYRIIKVLTPITPEIASSLYLTIRSDTGSFKNSNTDSKAHQVTSELLVYGANIDEINSIYENRSLSFVKLMGNTLADIQYEKKYKIAYLSVTRDKIKLSNSSDEEVSMLIDQIRGLQDCEIAFLFIEGISNIRISARSKNLPVDKILQYFGGGGHPKAAGCAMEDLYIEEVVSLVIEYTKNYMENFGT